MLGLTKTRRTDGLVEFRLRVPKAREDSVEAELRRIADAPIPGGRSIEEVFPDLGPGDALRGARELMDLSQRELAEAIGSSKSNISEMERGKRPIGKEMARKLAGVLKTNYKVFL